MSSSGLPSTATMSAKRPGAMAPRSFSRFSNCAPVRVAETIAAGGTPRADDNPESFRKRLGEYQEKTAPLSGYYASTGELKTVDGMKSIDDVTADLAAVLGEVGLLPVDAAVDDADGGRIGS